MRGCVLVLVISLLIMGSILAGPVAREQQPAPDNTTTNQGDTNKGATTARPAEDEPGRPIHHQANS